MAHGYTVIGSVATQEPSWANQKVLNYWGGGKEALWSPQLGGCATPEGFRGPLLPQQSRGVGVAGLCLKDATTESS